MGFNTSKGKTKYLLLLSLALVLLGLVLWTVWGNSALELNTYTITSETLPAAFSGYRIAQVSDLHNAEMGRDNRKLLDMLRAAEPDLIALTGDLIDSYDADIALALAFVQEAVEIAPCYFITGNHESRLSAADYAALEDGLTAAGVTVLHDSEALLEAGGQQISLVGIDDPAFAVKYGGVGTSMDPEAIGALSTTEGFTILLSHRPEFFRTYVATGMELVLSGHAHGGQIRLPLLGGLFAPGQGLLPEYDAGLYTEDQTTLVVSRGVGNSIFPFRFNNRPEIILIELQCA